MPTKNAKPAGPRCYLTRIPLDRDGYTKGRYARYYGVGAPLFRLEDGDGEPIPGFSHELRAADREAVVRMVRAQHPGAQFR